MRAVTPADVAALVDNAGALPVVLGGRCAVCGAPSMREAAADGRRTIILNPDGTPHTCDDMERAKWLRRKAADKTNEKTS